MTWSQKSSKTTAEFVHFKPLMASARRHLRCRSGVALQSTGGAWRAASMMLMCLALTVSLQAGFAVGCSDGSELCLDWIVSLPILWFGFRSKFSDAKCYMQAVPSFALHSPTYWQQKDEQYLPFLSLSTPPSIWESRPSCKKYRMDPVGAKLL